MRLLLLAFILSWGCGGHHIAPSYALLNRKGPIEPSYTCVLRCHGGDAYLSCAQSYGWGYSYGRYLSRESIPFPAPTELGQGRPMAEGCLEER
jgi:hypothetical protein